MALHLLKYDGHIFVNRWPDATTTQYLALGRHLVAKLTVCDIQGRTRGAHPDSSAGPGHPAPKMLICGPRGLLIQHYTWKLSSWSSLRRAARAVLTQYEYEHSYTSSRPPRRSSQQCVITWAANRTLAFRDYYACLQVEFPCGV